MISRDLLTKRSMIDIPDVEAPKLRKSSSGCHSSILKRPGINLHEARHQDVLRCCYDMSKRPGVNLHEARLADMS